MSRPRKPIYETDKRPPPKPTRNTTPSPLNGSVVAYSEQAVGEARRHPMHMSLDELIEVRKKGSPPPVLINEDTLYTLGQMGASLKSTAIVMGTTEQTLTVNPVFLSAWQSGRERLAISNRVNIVEQAAFGNVQAMIYLDKQFHDVVGDNPVVNVTINNGRPFEQVTSEDLLRVLDVDVQEIKPKDEQ